MFSQAGAEQYEKFGKPAITAAHAAETAQIPDAAPPAGHEQQRRALTHDEKLAKSLIVKVHNHLSRDVELAMETVVYTLAGFPERLLSHKPVTLSITPFLSCIEQDDRQRNHTECDFVPDDDWTASTSERFTAVRTSKNGKVLTNLRMDYELRSDGLANCCLYDYRMCWEKAKRCAESHADLSDEEKCENGLEHEVDSTVQTGLFAFRSPHPQRETWGVRFRRNHDQFFPVLLGPVIRSRVKQPSRFARQMLLLFKPFRHVNELREDFPTWQAAFTAFEKTASPRIQRYIANFEAIDKHRTEWESDLEMQERDRLRRISNKHDRVGFSSNDPLMNVDEDDDDLEGDQDVNNDPDKGNSGTGRDGNMLLFEHRQHDQPQLALYNAAIRSNVFEFTTTQTVQARDIRSQPQQQSLAPSAIPSAAPAWFRPATDHDMLNAVRTERLLKEQLQSLHKPVDSEARNKPPLSSPGSSSATAQLFSQPLSPRPAVFTPLGNVTSSAIAKEFKLNAKQTAAFIIIADVFMAELRCIDPADRSRPKQLRMFVGGPGGTGKSEIILALQCLFERNGKSHWLKSSAPTGTASNKINGSTIFSLFGISWRAAKSRTPSADDDVESIVSRQQSTRTRTIAKHRDTRFVIVDEVSMVGCDTFAAVDESLKVAKGGDASEPFAGVHIITFGDYGQLKPIRKASLFDAKSAAPTRSLRTQAGRLLWEQFNVVVMLNENERQRKAPAFGALLNRLRLGECSCCCRDGLDLGKRGVSTRAIANPAPAVCQRDSACDYHVLSSRYLDLSSQEARKSEWQTARIVTPSNPVSAGWNCNYAVSLGARTGQPVFVSVAEDERPKKCKSQLTNDKRKTLRSLPDSDTGSRLGVLPLVAGMRVILRKNIATELGLVNGAEGTIVEVTLDPREELPPGVFNMNIGELPRRHDLTYLPKSVVVRFDKLRLRERLPHTATANDVTIVPDTVSFVYEGFGGKKTIRRTQLPLTPCQSMTVPMVQGKTLGHFWVDLNVDDAPGHKMTCLYVMISRATDLTNVRLLQPFHHGQLHRCRDSAIRHEELRLLQIESSTLQQFVRSHPELAAGVFADVSQSAKSPPQPKRTRETLSDNLGACVVFLTVCTLYFIASLSRRRYPVAQTTTVRLVRFSSWRT